MNYLDFPVYFHLYLKIGHFFHIRKMLNIETCLLVIYNYLLNTNHKLPFRKPKIQSIPAGMKWLIPLLKEWDELHSILAVMTIPFLQEWNDHFNPTGMECHSMPARKKYASLSDNKKKLVGDLCISCYLTLSSVM